MYIPSSTYRLQFNKDFTFSNLQEIIPYFSRLRPGSVYASPVFSAVPGSRHGYDITDPRIFNPEIGTETEFIKLSGALRMHNIGWIQDIVPNHMAFHSNNKWLMDVLKFGKSSEYSAFFDIDWDHPASKNKIMVPILGADPDESIREGKIKLKSLNKELFFLCDVFLLPVNPDSVHLSLKVKEPAPDNVVALINQEPILLKELLSRQHYVLVNWQQTDSILNYRRFFTINGLISLCMEDEKVFDRFHSLILRMIRESRFDGLRIDHTDGLRKPAEYFNRLRARAGDEIYIAVEKILGEHESFDSCWPLQGSTGYDFMALLNGLFTGKGIGVLKSFYNKLTGGDRDANRLIYDRKKAILHNNFNGDLDNILRMIRNSGVLDQTGSVINPDQIREAVGEFLVCCPVYKIYSDHLPLTVEDREIVRTIISDASRKKPQLRPALLFLEEMFTGKMSDNPEKSRAIKEIFLRLMQYTGPIMAKGIEDSAMYIHAALISRNEVGDSMDAPGISADEFHRRMTDRRNRLPASMNATATHDTKRGEDVRARLCVLSDLPAKWKSFYSQWDREGQKYITKINGQDVPDPNERYFICQTILGIMPPDSKIGQPSLKRQDEYFQKALREAGIHSNWKKPDEHYEKAVMAYVHGLLTDRSIIRNSLPFFTTLREFGMVNSLSQVVLKCTCPGIPDFYQGTELWDFSLVDPDNRRPVNYSQRAVLLNRLMKMFGERKVLFYQRLYKARNNGSIKMWMIYRLLQERSQHFTNAQYIPLKVTGIRRKNVLAFARVSDTQWFITMVPLHPASIAESPEAVFGDGTFIELPLHAPRTWYRIWDEKEIDGATGRIDAHVMEFGFPVVLKGRATKTKRGSGILLHISSLPGKYGTGSLGPEAYEFIRRLKSAGQKYWQILPFNPKGLYNSPYSSPSAFAGNISFVDPEFVYRQYRLDRLPYGVPESSSTDFIRAQRIREKYIAQAWKKLSGGYDPLLRKRTEEFAAEHNYWLDDFLLFSLIAKEYGPRWNTWPGGYKNRNKKSLREFSNRHQAETGNLILSQYLFHEQFKKLKEYAASFEIGIIGDLPFYISHDSADVWAHPELFNLDNKGKMATIAGVPPDFFSKNGQLWNMPVYKWANMKSENYQWWIKRIIRNLEYCDLLRFDHFRGFSAYWEVPAGDKTARNGKWTQGPAYDFFDVLRKFFPSMPFIAEDLGNIDDEVYRLRDHFGMPGMRVLMFAFEGSMPHSVHIPHNYIPGSIVYTGTHDNNTLRGWYKQSGRETRKRISDYTGKPVGSRGINRELITLALSSVSGLAIIPVQDILGLDERSRLNLPAKAKGNWKWKLKNSDYKTSAFEELYRLTQLYGRI